MAAGGGGVRLDRVEDLQAAASSIFVPLQIEDLAGTEFRAVVQDAGLGPVILTRIQCTPAAVSRHSRLITSTDPEMLKITLHRQGRLIVAQDDRQVLMKPGELIAYDTSRPYRLIGEDRCDIVVIGVPRSMLGAGAERIARRTAVALPSDRGTRSVVTAFLSGLADTVDDQVPAGAGLHLAEALTSLVLAMFTGTTVERADASTELTDRIVVFALANLSDPGLSVATVAHHHGVSTRYVHKVFHRRGMTFAAWVRHERLLRIRRDLLDPALAHRTAAAIAAGWGILDATHLGRAFNSAFGQTAADVRRSASPYLRTGPEREPRAAPSRPPPGG